MKQRQPHVIRAKKQLAALVSAARQETVDVLSQMGTISVSELASALGRPADAIYYHLRTLKRAGLVMSAGNRNRGKRQEELFRTISPDLQLDYQLGERGNAREITAIVGSMLRLGARDFCRTFLRGDAKVSGRGRELWALRTTGWLTPAEVARVNRYIRSLANAVAKPRGKGKLYGITVLLTPLDHRARTSGTKAVPWAKK
jgi:DNA-binding transcriptional ArsR family regulator